MSGHADAVERVAFALWRRLDVPGHDACWLERIPAHGWSLAGHAVFRHDDGPASLAYQVLCDERWRALRGRVRGESS